MSGFQIPMLTRTHTHTPTHPHTHTHTPTHANTPTHTHTHMPLWFPWCFFRFFPRAKAPPSASCGARRAAEVRFEVELDSKQRPRVKRSPLDMGACRLAAAEPQGRGRVECFGAGVMGSMSCTEILQVWIYAGYLGGMCDLV